MALKFPPKDHLVWKCLTPEVLRRAIRAPDSYTSTLYAAKGQAARAIAGTPGAWTCEVLVRTVNGEICVYTYRYREGIIRGRRMWNFGVCIPRVINLATGKTIEAIKKRAFAK